MSLLLKNLQLIGCKIEDTRWTEETLADADFNVAAYDVSVKFMQEFEGRPIVNTNFTKYRDVVGAKYATLSFKVMLAKNSTNLYTIPAHGKLLNGCSMTNTLYTTHGISQSVDNTNCTTLTFNVGYINECSSPNAMMINIKGAVGKVKIVGKATKPVYLEFEFTGAFAGYEEISSIPTITIEDIMPDSLMDADLTIGGYSNVNDIDSLEIDIANVVELQKDISEEFGYKGAAIVDRNITVKVDPLVTESSSDRNWYTQLDAATLNPLSLQLTNFQIYMPELQLVNGLQFGDRGGMVTDTLDFKSAYAGNASDAEIYIMQGKSA
jgi:hypothetical protein